VKARRRVLVCWPAAGDPLLYAESDGRRTFVAEVDSDPFCADRQAEVYAALDAVFAWGRDPGQALPAGWRLVPPGFAASLH